MKIVQLTPGTGNFYCGSCLRDAALVAELKRLGHEVRMVPMYLPHVTEGDALDDTPIFFGGINVYLQQKSRLFRRTPRWLDRLFDRRSLLLKAADRAGMTAAKDLGQLTVSMLGGEEGKQGKELDRLIAFLKSEEKPDVICLSNAMLIGVARRLRQELQCPVVCTLAGEDSFMDSLIEPFRSQAWDLLRHRSEDVARFIAVSHYYGSVMRQRIHLREDQVAVVPNGIDASTFRKTNFSRFPTIGYLARMHPSKGLDRLIDAFIALRRRETAGDVKLCIIGACTPSDEPYLQSQMKKLQEADLLEHVEFHPNATPAEKRSLLSRMNVLSVPALYGESFGLYLLEAWASGVPVVQPRHAAFPELIEDTQGGILFEPEDEQGYVDGLERVLTDQAFAKSLAEQGHKRTLSYYNLPRMASEVAEVFRAAAALPSQEPIES